ncbi:hypothetical protein BH11PSE12_BH11PSE12_20560 [soil metagenome]
MVQLSDAFPLDFRKSEIEQRLVPGAVLYLEITFPEVIKNKYLVLVGTADPDILTFMVNSETNDYIRHRPELNICQVTLDQANHDFLDYDSKIACHQVHRLKKADVIDALLSDVNRLKGNISLDVRQEIVSAIKHATTLTPVIVRNILNGLN